MGLLNTTPSQWWTKSFRNLDNIIIDNNNNNNNDDKIHPPKAD